ncbi:hypothetical protein A9168_06075 [Macellibacteroides sp. HH-ZS]|nr:hypothetical protein A9168_06075 [Macellibacteroides sp. HH-ZS]
MSSKGKAGSLINFQITVENHEVLDSSILALNEDWKEGKINWYSPIEKTSFKEFYDNSFWNGKFKGDYNSFWSEMGNPNIIPNAWPKGGPSWDGIAVLTDKNGEKTLLLFEAKARKGELFSKCKATNSDSFDSIKDKLNSTRDKLGLKHDVDWMIKYFQFANRLAFHNYLQNENIKVALICIYFANDPYWTKENYTGIEEWKKAIKKEKDYFGIDNAFLESNHIYNLIIDLKSDPYKDILKKINDKLKENKVTCGDDVCFPNLTCDIIYK